MTILVSFYAFLAPYKMFFGQPELWCFLPVWLEKCEDLVEFILLVTNNGNVEFADSIMVHIIRSHIWTLCKQSHCVSDLSTVSQEKLEIAALCFNTLHRTWPPPPPTPACYWPGFIPTLYVRGFNFGLWVLSVVNILFIQVEN
jgi:hypothetical protein